MQRENMINFEKLSHSLKTFVHNKPFDHSIVDDFLDTSVAELLSSEFPAYDDACWYVYDNPLENKRALNNWNQFPVNTYKILTFLTSPYFVDLLSKELGLTLFADPGLHGGGWHIHGDGGNLNPHLDYSLHPKSGLMRKLNLIIYLSPELQPENGGQLGFWSGNNSDSHDLKLIKEIDPKFNRAVLFDTTQNSWHGLSRSVTVPAGVYRKSLAVYYLSHAEIGSNPRGKALYAPRTDQRGDQNILKLIESRADAKKFATVYRSKND